MKILLVSSGSGSRGGGEIFLDYLGSGLAKRGHEIVMWIPAHRRMDELAEKCARFALVVRAEYRNTYDHPARSLSTCFNRGTSCRIARHWEELRPDVIHLNKQNLEDGLDLLRAMRWCAVPSLCTIHLTQTARRLRARSSRLRDWIARHALNKYTGDLVAVQETRCKALNEFLGGHARTKTIFCGVPLMDSQRLRHVREDKRRELGLSSSEFLVLGLGRLVRQKRPFVFLKTAQQLHGHFPTAKFLWVGDGELAGTWNEWIAREGLSSVISCTGWQTDTLPFLLASDLLLHVAEYEALPFAILEAMAAGVPCAITRNLQSEIQLFDEHTVLFFDEPLTLANHLRNRPALEAMAKNARRLVQDKLSTHAMIESYEQLYARAGVK